MYTPDRELNQPNDDHKEDLLFPTKMKIKVKETKIIEKEIEIELPYYSKRVLATGSLFALYKVTKLGEYARCEKLGLHSSDDPSYLDCYNTEALDSDCSESTEQEWIDGLKRVQNFINKQVQSYV